MAGTKADAERFANDWAIRGDENQHTQLFWIGLFQDVLGLDDALERLQFEVPVHTEKSDHHGFIDVLIPTASAIVEQKSRGVDLDKPETRQGVAVTPVRQALDYTRGLPLSQRPRYVITCNFSTMRVYDQERDALCHEPLFELALEDLPKNVAALAFLRGSGEAPETLSQTVSVEAGKIMARLHALAARRYENPDAPEAHHSLSVLMTRLMFLMFAEDVGLEGPDGQVAPNAFRDYIRHFPAEDLRRALMDLFEWLDTPPASRDPWAPERLRAFPYMNGGLFRERINFPPLDEDFRTTLIVQGCQEFDWTNVSPTVFGSIFEGALSHDHRRENGQHFTSPANIHKVIDPLFLDPLRGELTHALEMSPSHRTRALRDLHERLGSMAVLDPAAGSGNFLTESYVSLRRLENRVMYELAKSGQLSMSFEETGEVDRDREVLVSLRGFHGIELEDFACCVARTALWIAEKQADLETQKVTRRVYQALPLTDYAGIVQGNALRMDWNDVLPASECDYVIGNPPFIGYSNLTSGQKADRELVFGGAGGTLDYVACWYRKAADYMLGTHARAALVSTNSICQGQQVEPLWRPLFEDGIHIDFAHRTFFWDSQSDDVAHVHVIIVGFSREQVAPKLLFDRDGTMHVASNINGYLADAPGAFVTRRSRPLCDVPAMGAGGKPTDGGYLLLSQDERDALVRNEPAAERWIRPFSMGAEFINGIDRYCLWLDGITPKELKAMPNVMERVQAVREFRLASSKAATRKKAETPWLFDEMRNTGDSYIAVAKVSSGRRRYVPIAYVTNGMVPGDSLYFISNGTLYEFGILMSQFHNAWMRTVAGRLKSDYRYTNTIVYNTFVWPDATPEQRFRIEACAQAVLDAREAYPDSTLADLYNPDDEWLYPQLAQAHRALDAAVEAAYGVDFGGDEEKIVAHLFRLYAERTSEQR